MTARQATGPALPTPSPSASNRASIPPTFEPQGPLRVLHEVLGIDHLALSFPVHPPGPEMDHADRADFYRERSVRSIRNLSYEVAGIRVTMKVAPGKDGWVAVVWFNPSEWTNNRDPFAALRITSLYAAVSAVWSSTLDLVVPRVAMTEAKVTRIDLARDFRVEAAGRVALMEALHKLPVPYAYSRPLYNSHRGVPETLYIGTASEGTVRVYDRHSKDPLIPAGTLRVEVEARKNWAARYGDIETVADIGPSTISDLFTDRFRWAKLDHPVIYESARLQHLWNLAQDPGTPGITKLAVVRFAGVERLQQIGIDAPQGTTATSACNAIRTALGVRHDSPEAPTCFRLDPAYDEPLVAA